MNILIFNWRDIRHGWAGGSEQYIHELAKGWVKSSNKVTLFCGQDVEKDLPAEEIIDGIHIIRKGGRFTVYLWAIIFYFKRLRKGVDIIVDVENGIPFFTPLYSRKKKICLVYHVHGRQFFVELPFIIGLVGFIFERYFFSILYSSMKIMAISKSTEKELVKLGFKKRNIAIINPGVEINDKGIDSIKKYVKPVVLYLGRIKRYKRIDTLINIFPRIIERNPSTRLIIAGWGSEAPFISDVVMKNKYRKKIELLGPVSEREKKELLSKSWVFINPSIHEGWGISVIEANLLKTPAVSFRVPGLSDSIQNGKTGLLSDTESDMANNINELLENNDLRKKMSSASRKWALQFKWENSSAKALRLLKKL